MPSKTSFSIQSCRWEEALHDEADLNDVVVKKLIRKIDYRLIPPLAFLYAIALVDRNNLPNARLAGMDQELGISIGNRYTFLIMMFFIPYILFELLQTSPCGK